MFNVGDKVIFTSQENHDQHPEWYPNVGTVGTIVSVDLTTGHWVKWRKGSTSGNDEWHSIDAWLKLKPQRKKKDKKDATDSTLNRI